MTADMETDMTSDPSEPILSVRALSKEFHLHHIDRRIVALRGVSFDVHRGEHVALVGPSGAGKSSVLKCVHRTYAPTGGSVVVATPEGPVDLAAAPQFVAVRLQRSTIGYVSQFLRAEPRRGAFDAVVRAGLRRGMADDDVRDRAASVLRQLGVAERLWDTPPTLLSGGEQQRVNLACGLVTPAPILLLDEPVASLDPVSRAAVLDLVAARRDGGAAIVSVFHDLDAVRRLADRVLLVSGGVIAADGTPDDVLGALTDPAVATAGIIAREVGAA